MPSVNNIVILAGSMGPTPPVIDERCCYIADPLVLCLKRRSGVEWLVSSLKFLVSGSTSEFQRSETNNLKLETWNLKHLYEIHFARNAGSRLVIRPVDTAATPVPSLPRTCMPGLSRTR